MMQRRWVRFMLFAITIVSLVCILYRHSMNEYPRYIHAWTQADRYAMALRYTEDDANFFQPRTFCLNTQFPAQQNVPNPEGITRADFPLNEYLVSFAMNIFGKQPAVFRAFVLLISILGLFFLYKLSFEIKRSVFASLLTIIFVFCAPVYTYYQNGFLPTISSFAFVVIGLYHYHQFLSGSQRKKFTITIALLTLAALYRLPFAIWIVAVAAHRCLIFIKTKTIDRKQILFFALSIILLALNFAYNNYLGKNYGSMFLTELMPAESWGEFKSNLTLIYDNWHLHYFSFWQYMIMLLLVALFSLRFKSNLKTLIGQPFFFLVTFSFIAAFGYFILMQRQFVAHDYYFLDTFFLPIIVLGILIIQQINFSIPNYAKIIIACVAFILIAGDAKNMQVIRRVTGDWDRTEQTFIHLQHSEKLLDSLHIPPDAKILMIDGYSPNMPFILMKRKGYFVLTTSAEKISEALQWNYNYVVLQNRYIESDITPYYPELFLFVDKIGDNGKISVYKPNGKKPEPTTTSNTLQPVLLKTYPLTFDTIAPADWKNTDHVSLEFFSSGKKSGILNNEIEFGATFQLSDSNYIHKKTTLHVDVSLLSQQKNQGRTQLVVSVSNNGKDVYYNSIEIASQITESNVWKKLNHTFNIPLLEQGYELKLYLWNQDKNNILYYDDLTISVFELK